MLSQGSASPFYMLPKSCQFLLPTRGPGLAVPSLLMGRREVEGSPSFPPKKDISVPEGKVARGVDAGAELFT